MLGFYIEVSPVIYKTYRYITELYLPSLNKYNKIILKSTKSNLILYRWVDVNINNFLYGYSATPRYLDALSLILQPYHPRSWMCSRTESQWPNRPTERCAWSRFLLLKPLSHPNLSLSEVSRKVDPPRLFCGLLCGATEAGWWLKQ